MKHPTEELDLTLRPIGARALKSASDTLRPWLAGARCLDLFAGQGRLGAMAIEEGAEHVVFVEKNRRQIDELKRAVKDTTRAKVLLQDVFQYLASVPAESFDVVFADPPFPYWAGDFKARLFAAVAPSLRPGAIFLVKAPARVYVPEPVSSYFPWKNVDFGESRLVYFKYDKGDQLNPGR